MTKTNNNLISTLILKNIIKEKTILTANHTYVDFNGTQHKRLKDFQVRLIKDGTIIANTSDSNINFKIPYEAIMFIDGMNLETTAKAFELKLDGSKQAAKIDPITGQAVRRGRKPNWVKEKMKEMES